MSAEIVERILSFLPSILGLLSLAVVGFFLPRIIVKRLGVENFKSIGWQKKNRFKVASLKDSQAYLFGPAREELIFRLPLVVAFSALSTQAWVGILVSAVIFAAVHVPGFRQRLNLGKLGSKMMMEEKKTQTDDIDTELREIDRSTTKNYFVIITTVRVASAFAAGIWLGYLGITNQSILLPFVVHIVLNIILGLFMPLVVILASLLVFLALMGLCSLWDKIRYWVRRTPNWVVDKYTPRSRYR